MSQDAGHGRLRFPPGAEPDHQHAPMLKQALAVHDLTLKHNNIHFARWREVQVPLEKENLKNQPKKPPAQAPGGKDW